MITPVRPLSAGTRLTAIRPASQAGTDIPRVEPIAPAYAVRVDRRADFLAQLIATRDDLPQTRLRRRASPAEAIEAYGRSAKTEVVGVGLFVSV